MARTAIALLLLAHPAAGAWRRVADLPADEMQTQQPV